MLIKRKRIESFLPVFCGFYGTIFEPSEDSIIESPYNYDNYKFYYDEYREAISKACCDAIENELKPLGIKVVYQNLYSPKEYNFSTDSINCLYKLSKDSAKLLNEYLLANYEAFETFIKDRCTSRSGFISFYSNDAKDWLTTYTKEKLNHTFGTMLEFYFENEGFTSEDLYYKVDSVSLDGEIKEGVKEANELINNVAIESYVNKPLETIVIELCEHFVKEGIDYDFLTFKYIESIVKEVFKNIDNKTLNLFANNK